MTSVGRLSQWCRANQRHKIPPSTTPRCSQNPHRTATFERFRLISSSDSKLPATHSSIGGQRQRAMTRAARSEEHTSELQSLMRISYAVFCLKKKNKKKQNSMNNRHAETQNNNNRI